MTKYAIWDIDNCLADDKWRASLIDFSKHGNERYDAYNAKMHADAAHHLREFRFMCRFTTPVFFTGRGEKWRDATLAWLRAGGYREACGDWYRLVMRADDDNATPAQLKHNMLIDLIHSGVRREDIIAAFDDIPAVVEMYQRHSIAGCVLQINSDFSGIYEPNDLAPISNHA